MTSTGYIQPAFIIGSHNKYLILHNITVSHVWVGLGSRELYLQVTSGWMTDASIWNVEQSAIYQEPFSCCISNCILWAAESSAYITCQQDWVILTFWRELKLISCMRIRVCICRCEKRVVHSICLILFHVGYFFLQTFKNYHHMINCNICSLIFFIRNIFT